MSIKKFLLYGTIFAFLLGGGLAGAEEIKPKPAIERTLEQKVSKPKISINFNYNKGSDQKSVDYSTSESTIYLDSNRIYIDSIRDSNVPELTLNQESQVKNIMSDIQNQNINSYQNLITASQNLSESQKLVLSSIRSNLLYIFNYDLDLSSNEVASQNDFFNSLQDSLISGNQNSLGTCGHIVTHTERFLNDIGIKSAAVSTISHNGIGHAYNISKIENGTAIIDAANILITNTKNIEKTLEAYQEYMGITTFEHLFFEDTQFKYRLITKDGKNFLNFIEYDETLESLKNALVENITPQADLTITLNLEDYLTSMEYDLFGFFVKAGGIRGDSSSALHNMNLIQAGFKRNVSIPNIVDIKAELSFMFGDLSQDTKLDDNKIGGIKANLVVATNNKKGFNLSSRIAGNLLSTKDSALSHDLILGAGTSYKIPIKNTSIEPYIISQFAFFPKDIGTYQFRPKLSELVAGTVVDIGISDINFSIDAYYLQRIWEQGFGGNIEIKGKNIGINAKGDATWSMYEFCPDKYNFSIGPFLRLGNLKIEANYKTDRTNYDGEIENKSSLDVQAGLKF